MNLGQYIAQQILLETPSPKINLDLLKDFVKFTLKELGVRDKPAGIILSRDLGKVREMKTMGTFEPGSGKIWIYVGNRNMADICRTLAHELVHHKQGEEGRLQMNSGDTGSDIENEANSVAGVILRKFGKINPNIYESQLREKGEFGNYLFGDKDSGVDIGWYEDEVEPDTASEKELFNILRKYADSEESTYSNINLDSYVPIFKQLKISYPDIANPNIPGSKYIYRGTALSKEQLQKEMDSHPTKTYSKGTLILDTSYASRRIVQSWSTHYFTAATFAMSTASRKGGIPIIMRALAGDADLIFNPKFMTKLSDQFEEEVFNMKNPIKVDMIVLEPDTYEDEFDNIEAGYLHNKQ